MTHESTTIEPSQLGRFRASKECWYSNLAYFVLALPQLYLNLESVAAHSRERQVYLKEKVYREGEGPARAY